MTSNTKPLNEYVRVRQSHHTAGTLYEDKEFVADKSSLFGVKSTKSENFEWKRAKDIDSSTKFVIDDIKQFDVVTGSHGNPAIASALSVLCQYRGLFYRAVPADQGFGADFSYSGVFHFRFWWAGEWVEVIIDDQLPTIDGQLVFTHTNTNAQMWPALLEKAYAKLHGSYEALTYATLDELLSELSGGVTELVSLDAYKPSEILELVQNTLRSTIICAAVTPNELKREHASSGLLPGRAYTILAIDKVTDTTAGTSTTLFRIRHTPGGPKYDGPWSQTNGVKWMGVDVKSHQIEAADAGAFWITLPELEQHFDRLQLTHFDSDTCHSEPKLRELDALYTRSFVACWAKGATAGGCRNHIESFHINPQFLLTVNDECSVVIAVLQHRTRQPHVVGFSVYKLPTEQNNQSARLTKQFFRQHKAVYHSTFGNQKQLTCRVPLNSGTYVVIPCTYEPGKESLFTIRLYSQTTVSCGILDAAPSIEKTPVMKGDPQSNEYQAMFLSFADEKKSVNAYELQELLHTCLPNDYMKSSANMDVCRKVVMAFQRYPTAGRIDYNQFKDFMYSLKVWQEIFGYYSKTTSGVMKSERFRDALGDVGFKLSTEIIQILILRYMRRDGTLRFGDFVSCILQLIAAFNTFQRKDSTKCGVVKLNNTEWMKSVLRC